ncbi:MAG TPA: type I pullulanase [Firmicutes bacterium]|nr:type I pullulanase [Bacillota bacterium]
MRKQLTFEAYLDRYESITAYLKKSYYDGESLRFRLKSENTPYTDLAILDKVEDGEYIKYTLAAPALELGHVYQISDDHNLVTTLQYGYVVRTAEFDEDYFYEGNDLGVTYTKTASTFKVWSPIATQIKIEIKQNNETKTLDLARGDKGVWSLTVEGDFELASYIYLVKVNGTWNQATDPYAIASTPNHKRTVVLDLAKISIDSKRNLAPSFESYTDAIIYEMHVRDFSVHANSGIKNVGKFLGVVEEGTRTDRGTLTGLDYLCDLGVTHIQLLPTYDFGSVDETNQFEYYNWGYDPVQYNVPEGSYATDVYNPYSRVIEMKQMIAKLHEKGFRVTMDVVYNHMFDRQTSAFENIMPNYYFRLGENGEISNGSFCGNDVDTLRKMCRKYVVDSCKMWVSDYGFDGFRFDLMGILDIETMNELTEACLAIDSSVMVYGEGWNMPTLMDDELKAMMFNNKKMPNIAHFNDQFGRGIKGSPFEHEMSEIGYGLGFTGEMDRAMNVIAGSCTDIGTEPVFVEPSMTLNYVECHDNMTLFDKIMLSNKCESLETRMKRQKMITALIMVSQGVAFIHAGQEFARTKGGDHNSYMSPDSVNQFDWDLKDENIELVEFVKGFINLRKEQKALRLNTAAEVKKHVTVVSHEDRVIEYTVSDVASYGGYNDIKIFMNPTHEAFTTSIEDGYKVIANRNGVLAEAATVKDLTVNSVELVVLAK